MERKKLEIRGINQVLRRGRERLGKKGHAPFTFGSIVNLKIIRLSLGWAILLGGCDLPPRAFTPQQIWEKASPSVLRIESVLVNGGSSTGTGFVTEIEGQKVILTNRHVVLGAEKVMAGPDENSLKEISSYKIAKDHDLAILEMPEGVNWPALILEKSAPAIASEIFAIGFPQGLTKSITKGLVSSDMGLIVQFDASVSSGNSGGPLLNAQGRAVGVVTAVWTDRSGESASQNLNFAITCSAIPKLELFSDPVTKFFDCWKRLCEKESQIADILLSGKVIELRDLLVAQVCFYAQSDSPSDPQANVTKQHLATQIESLADGASLNEAIDEARIALQESREILESISIEFAAVQEDPLMSDFLFDTRPIGIGMEGLSGLGKRMKVQPNEFATTLQASIRHVLETYDDAIYQLEFYKKYYTRVLKNDRALLDVLNDKNLEKVRRPFSIDYSRIASDDDALFAFYLSLSDFLPHEDANATALTSEYFAKNGGFESELLGMFSTIAIEFQSAGSISAAINAMKTDVAHRRFPSYRLLAHMTACSGNYAEAYSLYRKGFEKLNEVINIWTLDKGENLMLKTLYLLEVSGSFKGRHSLCPPKVGAQWDRFQEFCVTQGKVSRVTPSTLNDLMDAGWFDGLDRFEKCRIIQRITDLPILYQIPMDTCLEVIKSTPQLQGLGYGN